MNTRHVANPFTKESKLRKGRKKQNSNSSPLSSLFFLHVTVSFSFLLKKQQTKFNKNNLQNPEKPQMIPSIPIDTSLNSYT